MKKTFVIYTEEVCTYTYEVQAESASEADEIFNGGEINNGECYEVLSVDIVEIQEREVD